eukprot:UN18269
MPVFNTFYCLVKIFSTEPSRLPYRSVKDLSQNLFLAPGCPKKLLSPLFLLLVRWKTLVSGFWCGPSQRPTTTPTGVWDLHCIYRQFEEKNYSCGTKYR